MCQVSVNQSLVVPSKALWSNSISRTRSIFALFLIHTHRRARAIGGMIKKKCDHPRGPSNGLDQLFFGSGSLVLKM